jgi:antitoxin PrlF
MQEHLTVVTRKGQVTIPVEIRRKLGLKEGDKVAFAMEADRVLLTRSDSVVTRTAGALKSEAPLLSAEEERAAAEQAIAEDVVQRLGT